MTSDADEPDVLSAFGSYLRSQRRLAQLTLRELSELTNISNPYLSQIERGVHNPSVTVISSIAKALGLSVETLLAHAAGVEHSATDQDGTIGADRGIRDDPFLSDSQKQALLAVYWSYRREAEVE
jgi:transcriptional regulator with XRE-family HTH domain